MGLAHVGLGKLWAGPDYDDPMQVRTTRIIIPWSYKPTTIYPYQGNIFHIYPTE